MHLGLKFATDIIRPWEKLNLELINQNSIDSDISDFINNAEAIAIKLSHFVEVAGRKELRTNRKSIPFTIIVDIADAAKHNDVIEGRSNKLSISSQFEGNQEGLFRFLRNSIKVEHNKYGTFDFLQIAKEAANYLFASLNLTIFWNPPLLDAPNIFVDKVFLGIYFSHQITWSKLNIEFFKRETSGKLIHYDPPSWLFELRSPMAIYSDNYHDYVIELLKRSINLNSTLSLKPELKLTHINSNEIYIADAIIKEKNESVETLTLIKIIDTPIDLPYIKNLINVLNENNIEKIIIISETEFSREVKESVCLLFTNVYLVSIDKFDAENIPIDFFKIKYKHSNIKFSAIHKLTIGVLKEDEALFIPMAGKKMSESELGTNFSLDKVNLLSLKGLCIKYIKPKEGQINGRVDLNFKPRDKTNIYFKIADNFVKIGIEIDFEWESENTDLRMPILVFNKSYLGVTTWDLQSYFNYGNELQLVNSLVTKYGDTSAVGII